MTSTLRDLGESIANIFFFFMILAMTGTRVSPKDTSLAVQANIRLPFMLVARWPDTAALPWGPLCCRNASDSVLQSNLSQRANLCLFKSSPIKFWKIHSALLTMNKMDILAICFPSIFIKQIDVKEHCERLKVVLLSKSYRMNIRRRSSYTSLLVGAHGQKYLSWEHTIMTPGNASCPGSGKKSSVKIKFEPIWINLWQFLRISMTNSVTFFVIGQNSVWDSCCSVEWSLFKLSASKSYPCSFVMRFSEVLISNISSKNPKSEEKLE